MPETPPYYVWPMADGRTLTLAILFLVGLFVGAVLLELYRRRKDKHLRLQAEWRAVRDFCRERELLDDDYHLIRAIIAQYAGETPFKAVTRRHLFDTCMGKYFRTLAATSEIGIVAERGIQLREVRVRLGLDYVPLGQRIYSTRELYNGQTLWCALADGTEPRWFHVTVASVDEAYFHIEPVGTDATPDFSEGNQLKMRLWREEDARYLFDAQVHNVSQRPRSWTIGHVEALTRNQARAHFRIRFEQAASVQVLSAPVDADYSGLGSRPAVTQLHGRVSSLSGGGLAIVFSQPVPTQVILKIPVQLPHETERRTVYVRPIGSQRISGGRSLVRGKFVALDEETQDAITRYVFLKQKQNASDEKY